MCRSNEQFMINGISYDASFTTRSKPSTPSLVTTLALVVPRVTQRPHNRRHSRNTLVTPVKEPATHILEAGQRRFRRVACEKLNNVHGSH